MRVELVEWMRAAWEENFRVIPMGPNKRPAVAWADIGRVELDQLLIWAAGDYDGYGILCGGPERLIVFDFEAGFDQFAFAEALRDAGLFDVFEGWMSEFWVRTPSGGMHVAVHLIGEGAVPGNTKLAADAAGRTTAETRGEGGLVVGPGSNGRTHPTGGQWTPAGGVGFKGIQWVTREAYDAVCAVIVSMSEALPVPARAEPAEPPAPGSVTLGQLERSSSWIDTALGQAPTLEQVLVGYGWWTSDGQWWWRPGKDHREQHSARINENGRLYVWSTSTPIPASDSQGDRTYDVVDIICFYEKLSRVEVLRRWKPAWVAAEAEAPASDLCLPAGFWESRPYLDHIARAAWSRQVSPDLVWEAFKAMYASTIPWNFRLPDEGTLDYISIMVGDSGSGKTQAKRAAAGLLPEAIFEIEGLNPLLPPPASGEGLAEWFLDRSKNAAPGALANRGGCMYLDEGQAFFDMAGRAGNITTQTLKSAWSGELVGSLAATADRRRVIQPSAVRACVLISIQIGAAAQFLAADLAAGGLPQRISWGWAYHNDIPDHTPDWPGRLDVPVYDYHHWGGGSGPAIIHVLDVDPAVQAEIGERRLARRRSPQTDTLEAQADYAKLKAAAILALLDDRVEVQSTDWNLAAIDWQTGVKVREHVAATKLEALDDKITTLGRQDAVRHEANQLYRIELAAAALGRKVWRSETPIPSRQAKDSIKQYDAGPYTPIRDHAVDLGYIVVHSEGGLVPGGKRPPKRGGWG